MNTIKEVSDEVERAANYLFEQLANLTKKSYLLTIHKEKDIVSMVEIKCGKSRLKETGVRK